MVDLTLDKVDITYMYIKKCSFQQYPSLLEYLHFTWAGEESQRDPESFTDYLNNVNNGSGKCLHYTPPIGDFQSLFIQSFYN